MPFIYKITNTINGKAYIGKTMFSVEKRWREHCTDRLKPRCERRPLYDAMNKYGIENFTIETIEECAPEDAALREKYWIQYFNTFKDGYNATLGGDGNQYIDYDTVVEVYCLVNNVFYTANILGIDCSQCYNILHMYGVLSQDSMAPIRWVGIPVSMFSLSGEYICSFDSVTNAARYVTNSANPSKATSHITDVCKGRRKSAYGYKWEFMMPEDENED